MNNNVAEHIAIGLSLSADETGKRKKKIRKKNIGQPCVYIAVVVYMCTHNNM